ncbi:MAG: hypothetical protein NVSMB10_08060 [Steroidobacteraceae bacterium]
MAVKHDAERHQFTIDVDGELAVLDYTLARDVMTITHTGVPTAIAGRGVAAELMKTALAVGRGAGWSINPVCSYAAAYMRRHGDRLAHQHEEELLDETLDESLPPGLGRAG